MISIDVNISVNIDVWYYYQVEHYRATVYVSYTYRVVLYVCLQVGSRESISHTIGGLHPYTNYTFSVSARVRDGAHCTPAASASALTKETAALVNLILRVPLVECLAAGSSDSTEAASGKCGCSGRTRRTRSSAAASSKRSWSGPQRGILVD